MRYLHLLAIAGVAVFVAVPSAHAQVLYSNNFNSGNGGLTVSNGPNTLVPFAGPWVYSGTAGVGGTGGWRSDGQLTENMQPNTTNLTTPSLTVTTTGPVTLSFAHRYSFEFSGGSNWDGGAVFISTNGGATFNQLPLASFTANGYNGSVQSTVYTGVSDLRGQPAFVMDSTNYATSFLTTTANLGTLTAGTSLQVRFSAAYDSNTQGAFIPNWEFDNLVITGVPEPSSLAMCGVGLALIARRWRRKKV